MDGFDFDAARRRMNPPRLGDQVNGAYYIGGDPQDRNSYIGSPILARIILGSQGSSRQTAPNPSATLGGRISAPVEGAAPSFGFGMRPDGPDISNLPPLLQSA